MGLKKQVERMAKILGRVVVKDSPKMENKIGTLVFSVNSDILKSKWIRFVCCYEARSIR